MAKVSTSELKKTAAPGGRKLFPTGKTLIKVTFAERGLSRTGNERLTLTYEGQVGDSAGMKIRDDLYYTLAQSNWKVALVNESLGVDEFDPDDAEALLRTFVGKKMFISVAEDEYTSNEGDIRMGRKISFYESVDPKVADAQRAEREKRLGASSGASRSDRSATPGMDADIPF